MRPPQTPTGFSSRRSPLPIPPFSKLITAPLHQLILCMTEILLNEVSKRQLQYLVQLLQEEASSKQKPSSSAASTSTTSTTPSSPAPFSNEDLLSPTWLVDVVKGIPSPLPHEQLAREIVDVICSTLKESGGGESLFLFSSSFSPFNSTAISPLL
jgi:hypothetical protein